MFLKTDILSFDAGLFPWISPSVTTGGTPGRLDMELRDITGEAPLLKSYKTVFVDSQRDELLKPYRGHRRTFPIFTERVFVPAAGASPVTLLKYVTRAELDDADVGRIFILERTDTPTDATRTRLYWVWISPKLLAQFAGASSNDVHVSASVIFHPAGGLDKYPAYWNGGIDPVKIPNFLELGARYLCKEKVSVTQHFCTVKAPASPSGHNPLDDKRSPLAVMVVVPVSSVRSFASLGNAKELQDALEQVAKRCYEGVTSKLLPSGAIQLDRVAVAGYSRSGVVLRALLDSTKSNDAFMRDVVKEFYAFDVMLDEIEPKTKKVIKTKREGYDELWARLKTWQGDNSDRRIRLYSAEPGTVAGVYSELQTQLKKYGGGYHNATVKFSAFNGSKKLEGSVPYSGLVDGYEIYSTDNSRSLVVLPFGNSLVYLSSEGLANAGGFRPGGDYEPELEGHSWFVSRLQSHALYHSGF